ncbi:MAG: signal peptidase I [Clostridia bacterium]|nr:signal peptidase I [Clostridia bacterium]
MKALKIKSSKTIKRIVTGLLSAAIVLMTVVVAYLTYCNISGKVAYIGKYASVKIITPSMEPTIPTGTYILSEKVQASQVSKGDIILFRSADPQIYGKINTHRVVEVNFENGEYSFVTRGDNNSVNDAYPVSEKDLVGRYVKNAEGLSAFAGFFSKPAVFFIFVIIPAAALVIFSMTDVVKKAKETRKNMLIEAEIKRLQESETESKESNDHVPKDEPKTKD